MKPSLSKIDNLLLLSPEIKPIIQRKCQNSVNVVETIKCLRGKCIEVVQFMNLTYAVYVHTVL